MLNDRNNNSYIDGRAVHQELGGLGDCSLLDCKLSKIAMIN